MQAGEYFTVLLNRRIDAARGVHTGETIDDFLLAYSLYAQKRAAAITSSSSSGFFDSLVEYDTDEKGSAWSDERGTRIFNN